MACTHPAAARPRAGSGEASIGSKERSSKRDAGLGAWRLSWSVPRFHTHPYGLYLGESIPIDVVVSESPSATAAASQPGAVSITWAQNKESRCCRSISFAFKKS